MGESESDALDTDAEPALEHGYRLSFILDPDGRVRQVAEASGIGAWPQEGYVGRTLGDISAERAGDERGTLWDVRIELAQEATAPVLYLDRVPGAPVDAPESVSSTVIPVRTAAGELQAIVVTLEDRSAVGPREAQVRASEAKFRHLAETLPHMVWESDGAGNARYISPRWESFTGRPARELLGRGWAESIHPDDLDRLAIERDAARARPEGGQASFSFRLRRHDGEYRWMEAYIELIRDDDNNPIQAFGAMIDVTERRRAEEARLRSQKRELVGTLLGGVAHDFNNVISAILSNAALARREFAGGLGAETSLIEIERGASRAADLVRRVLLHGRDVPESRGPVDVSAVVVEACDLLRSGLPRNLHLRLEIDEALPPIVGNSTQIHQIVINLITNARQAIGDGGGVITVSAATEEAPIGEADHAVVVLRVTDDGPGMPHDVLERAFDPYFTTKPVGEGSGLGLAAVQTIVRDHGGVVDVTTSPGAGTTVAIGLPIAPQDTTSGEPELAAPDANAAPDRPLMFVDDEAPLVKLAERALPVDGLTPVGFTDPVDARSAFDAEPARWSALVTDLSMPGLDGLSLIEHVRTRRPDLPIVLTSGYLRPHDRARAAGLGVAVVPKPCSMADLASAVRAAAGGASA